MNHPYRTLPKVKEIKKKHCFFFHDWEIHLKPNSYIEKISQTKIHKEFYLIVIKESYNLKCSYCDKEKSLPTNPYYLQMIIEDIRKFVSVKDYGPSTEDTLLIQCKKKDE